MTLRWFGKGSGRWWLVAAIALGSTGCDQATKAFAARYLEAPSPVAFLGDTIRLQYAENTGAFLSLGASLDPAVRNVVLISIVPAILLAWLVLTFRDPMLGAVRTAGAALIAGGAIGNILDRIVFGYVRDFAVVGFGPLRTGIFNLADVVLFLGGLLVVFGGWHRVAGEERIRPQQDH